MGEKILVKYEYLSAYILLKNLGVSAYNVEIFLQWCQIRFFQSVKLACTEKDVGQ